MTRSSRVVCCHRRRFRLFYRGTSSEEPSGAPSGLSHYRSLCDALRPSLDSVKGHSDSSIKVYKYELAKKWNAKVSKRRKPLPTMKVLRSSPEVAPTVKQAEASVWRVSGSNDQPEERPWKIENPKGEEGRFLCLSQGRAWEQRWGIF